MNFTILPNLIALAVLVAVFWGISRKATSERLYLWLAGWVLVLLHFTAQFLSGGNGTWSRIATAASINLLVLASIAFLISVSVIASSRNRQITLALSTAVPAIAYTSGAIWGVTVSGYYYGLIAAGVVAPLLWCWGYFPRRRRLTNVLAGLIAAGGIMSWAVAHGLAAAGITIILAASNFVVAILYWNSYRRSTAGVITAVAGFALWGSVFPIAISLAIFFPAVKVEGEVWNIPKYLVAVGMILTLLEDQIETSKYLAYHDELTGLPNRRLLEDRLARALAYAFRAGTKVAVLQLDLDRFKEINDTYGHRVGDVALREVVARLATCIQPGDTLARSGGDEFTVISYVKDLNAAKTLVAALELTLSPPVHIDGHEVQTGLSIGVALYPDDGSNPDQLHSAADRAMYTVKRATRAPTAEAEAVSQVSI